jgi:hypothetical protein
VLHLGCRPSHYPTCLHAISLVAAVRVACATIKHMVAVARPILGRATTSLTTLQPSDNPVVNGMHRGGEVLVSKLRCTVADDDIAIGGVADRCLLSGVKQTSHFKGVRTVFDPERSSISTFKRDILILRLVSNRTGEPERWSIRSLAGMRPQETLPS